MSMTSAPGPRTIRLLPSDLQRRRSPRPMACRAAMRAPVDVAQSRAASGSASDATPSSRHPVSTRPGHPGPTSTPAFMCAWSARATSAGPRSASRCCARAIADAGLADQVRVSSAGTGDWHIGAGRQRAPIGCSRRPATPPTTRARQITRHDLAEVDLALAADRGPPGRAAGDDVRPRTRCVLFRRFDPDADGDEVPDPYFGPDSGFDEVLAMTEAAVPGHRRGDPPPAGRSAPDIGRTATRLPGRPVTNTRERADITADDKPRRRWAFLASPAGSPPSWRRLAFAGACFWSCRRWQFNRNAERTAQNDAVDAVDHRAGGPRHRPDVDHGPAAGRRRLAGGDRDRRSSIRPGRCRSGSGRTRTATRCPR